MTDDLDALEGELEGPEGDLEALKGELGALRPRPPGRDLQARIARRLGAGASGPARRGGVRWALAAAAAVAVFGVFAGWFDFMSGGGPSVDAAAMTLGNYNRLARESPDGLMQALDRQSRSQQRDDDPWDMPAAIRGGLLDKFTEER